jgi:hypothetical protein
MVKNQVLAKLVRSVMVVGLALGTCLMVTSGCQENGKATPTTAKQAKETKAAPKTEAKPAATAAKKAPPSSEKQKK